MFVSPPASAAPQRSPECDGWNSLIHPPWFRGRGQRKLKLEHGGQVDRMKPGVKVFVRSPLSEGGESYLYPADVVVARDRIRVKNANLYR